MKNNYQIIIFIIVSLVSFRCSEDYLETVSPNELDAATFWDTKENVEMAVIGAYNPIREGDYYGDRIQFYFHQASHEYDLDYLGDRSWNQFKNFAIAPDNAVVVKAWNAMFRTVQRANDCIQNIPEVPENVLSQEEKDILLGQAYFLRGFAYFDLLKMFGKYYPEMDGNALAVPLITKVAKSRKDMFNPRATVTEIKGLIMEDLAKAAEMLPESWNESEKGKATSWAAKGYLAKLHMWFHEWEEAESYLEDIINNGTFRLMDNYRDNFRETSENNEESLFEVQFARLTPYGGHMGGDGNLGALRHAPPQLGYGNVKVSQYTADRFLRYFMLTNKTMEELSDFEYNKIGNPVKRRQFVNETLTKLNDLLDNKYESETDFYNDVQSRLTNEEFEEFYTLINKFSRVYDPRWYETAFHVRDSLAENGVEYVKFQHNFGYGVKKFIHINRSAYGDPNAYGNNAINYRLMRLADIYLLYAECKNERGDVEAAREYVNRVRERANKGSSEYNIKAGLTNQQMTDSIQNERYLELTGEFQRYQDLIRWDKAEEVLGPRGFKRGLHEAMPIPYEEMDLNPSMVQNEGYF